MVEISLICPSCAAEYSVPIAAIPPQGREVQCAECGNIWRVTRGPAPDPVPQQVFDPEPQIELPTQEVVAQPAQPSETAAPFFDVPLHRRLPENVLKILREEVEHERRARALEAGRPLPDLPMPQRFVDDTPSPPPSQRPAKASDDDDWVVTTVVAAPAPTDTARPTEDADGWAADLPESVPAVGAARTIVATPAPQPDTADIVEPPAATTAAPVTAEKPARSGYRAGLGLGLAIAASLLALYVLAPAMADAGPFGAWLAEMRESVDQVRDDMAETVGR